MRKSLIPAFLFLLGIAGTSVAYEIDQGPSLKAGDPNVPAANHVAPLGFASGSMPPNRVVNLDKGTTFLNVTQMETVKITVAGKSVTWTFDTLGTPTFPLSKIIPEAEGITVYVAPNPLYLS